MTTAAPIRVAALTEEQERAVARRDGSLLLAANAGSGKTSVLVERFVRAVHEDGVAPSRILAITFTERAAGELRERVRRRLRELGDRAAARDAEGAFVSTIHGFCARLLRAHPLSAGLAPGFGVLDAGTAAELRDAAFERALAGWLDGEGALELAAACGIDRLAATIMGVHDELRSRGRTRPRLPPAVARHALAPALAELDAAGAVLAGELAGAKRGLRVDEALAQLARVGAPLAGRKLHRGAAALKGPTADAYEAVRVRCLEAEADELGLVALALLDRLLAAFAEAFAAAKAARGSLDFDDLELSARDLLLGDAELRARWAERFDLLMVDELQDTNPREMAILEALDRDNLFTVGDEFQSIYGFRHADVDIFRRRRRALAGLDGVRVLSRNFRTRPALLRTINATFAPLLGPDFVALEPGRDAGPGAEPLLELMLCDTAGWEDTAIGGVPGSGPLWRRAEAALLAARIEQLIGGGEADPGEVVVLLRYATAASIYEQALVARGVPVAPAPGGGFYAGQVVCDLAAYVRVLANPLDDEALYGVLASPLCGAGSDTLAVVGMAARRLGRAPWEVLQATEVPELGAAERARLEQLRAHIVGEREAAAAGAGPAELLVRSGYRERGLSCGAGGGAAAGLANLRKLLRLARDFEAREGRDLRAFADRLAAGRLGAAREQDAELGETDTVRLMTVHAAKGLEFPVVCLADLGHGPPLGGPVILTDGERVGVRVPTLASTRVDSLAYAELRAERDPAALAEEQRIAYVAMTRARERLILSGAAHFARWPAASASAAPIAWLGPALVPDLRTRVQGPPGLAELDVGGARMRLTLTGAEGWIAPAAPRPRPRPEPVQLSLFDLAPASAALAGSPHGVAAAPEDAASVGPRSDGVPSAPTDSAPAGLPADQVPTTARAGPLSVSYSSLVDHARCGYGYYLRRVLGLSPVAPPPGLGEGAGGAAARGTLVHALLERLDFGRPRPPGPAAVRALPGAAGLGVEEIAEVVELVAAFAASPLRSRLAAATGVLRESSFGLTVGGMLLGGYIDVLAREAGGAMLVVDYKSDRIDACTDVAARVAADYDVQRRVYALAALRGGATSVEVAYCFLRRADDVVAVRFGAADAGRLEQELTALAAPLAAGRFDVARSPHRGLCATCPGRARLCSWDETVTLGEQGVVHAA